MLAAQGISLSYRGRRIIDDASFALHPREVAGLIAPNGVGKTTLMRALAGVGAAASDGAVIVDGDACDKGASRYAKTLYVSNEPAAFHRDMTARYHLAMAEELWPESRSARKAVEMLEAMTFLNKPVRKLSLGMRQLLALAIAFTTGATYVLLDEPLNGLDPGNMQKAVQLIRSMAVDGSSVLISSHLMECLDALCSRFLFLHQGKVVEAVAETVDGIGVKAMYQRLYGGSGLEGRGKERG